MKNGLLIAVVCLSSLRLAHGQSKAIDTVRISKDTTLSIKPVTGDTLILYQFAKDHKYQVKINVVKDKPGHWYDRLSLSKSVDSKEDLAAPAFVNLVFPKDSVSSQNFGFALSYNVWPSKSHRAINFKPFFEWQKNTLTSKKQDVIQAGLNFQSFIAKADEYHFFNMYAIASANFKRDAVNSANGTQANLYFTPIFAGSDYKFYFLPDAYMKNSVLALSYNLYAGFEYENVAKAKKSINLGTSFRAYGRITATINPLPDLLNKRLEFVPDYVIRRDLSNSISSEQNLNKLWKYAVNFKILTKDDTNNFADVSIGYDFSKGVDPTTSFPNQQVGTISLKVKIH